MSNWELTNIDIKHFSEKRRVNITLETDASILDANATVLALLPLLNGEVDGVELIFDEEEEEEEDVSGDTDGSEADDGEAHEGPTTPDDETDVVVAEQPIDDDEEPDPEASDDDSDEEGDGDTDPGGMDESPVGDDDTGGSPDVPTPEPEAEVVDNAEKEDEDDTGDTGSDAEPLTGLVVRANIDGDTVAGEVVSEDDEELEVRDFTGDTVLVPRKLVKEDDIFDFCDQFGADPEQQIKMYKDLCDTKSKQPSWTSILLVVDMADEVGMLSRNGDSIVFDDAIVEASIEASDRITG